ncbi:MAG: hypothetical protein ACKVP7_24180 [Hyphomicrobiaceae bacterium]
MSFTLIDLIYALAFGLIVGALVLAGFNSQHADTNAGALAALREKMGSLYNVAMLAAGGLPMMVVGLLTSSLRGAPTLADIILLIVLIGLALLATFTLLGNAMHLLSERTAAAGKS